MTFKIKKTSLKWLQKHWNCKKINKVKVLPVKTKCACARAHVAKSGATENNTCTYMCRIYNLISAEKATFQREKCLAMFFLKFLLVCVHPIRDALGKLGEHLSS